MNLNHELLTALDGFESRLESADGFANNLLVQIRRQRRLVAQPS